MPKSDHGLKEDKGMSAIAKASLMAAAALAAISVVALTSAAPLTAKAADKPGGEQCFNSHFLNGFNAPNEHTLYIRVGVNDVFRLDLEPGCTGIDFRQDIGLRSEPPGDSFICSPLQMEVVYGGAGGPSRCQVSGMTKLTPAEYAALPKRDRP
jgi:hypothetical protein